MFKSKNHKVNYLLKRNRKMFDRIFILLRIIKDNEKELVRVLKDKNCKVTMNND